jgi:hypothetical protein
MNRAQLVTIQQAIGFYIFGAFIITAALLFWFDAGAALFSFTGALFIVTTFTAEMLVLGPLAYWLVIAIDLIGRSTPKSQIVAGWIGTAVTVAATVWATRLAFYWYF